MPPPTLDDVVDSILECQERRRKEGLDSSWENSALDSPEVFLYAQFRLRRKGPKHDDDSEYFAMADKVVHEARNRLRVRRILSRPRR